MTVSLHDDAEAPESDDVVQDPEWGARRRRRLRAAMELLSEQSDAISLEEFRGGTVTRVPLLAYDESTTTSGSIRWRDDLFWYLLTNYTHAGWLFGVPSVGYRITAGGRRALDEFPTPTALFDAGNEGYRAWDVVRKEMVDDQPFDAGSAIVHGGNAAGHAFRGIAPVLQAWRNGGSAFQPGTDVWSARTAGALLAYLQDAPTRAAPELPGLTNDAARILAAEAMVLLLGPLDDIVSSTKRTRIRTPLMHTRQDPPSLPMQLSADLDHGFVRGGRTLGSDPMVLLRSFAVLLDHWWSLPAATREGSWNDPWQWRDAVSGHPGVDDRLPSLLCLIVHPGSFTTLLRPSDHADVVRAFADRLTDPTGDVERDLKSIVIELQVENGGRGVDLLAPPLVSVWSGTTENEGAWLVRGQVESQDLVPSWRQQGAVTLNTGRFRHLPAEPNQGSLSAMVDDLYSDLSPVKRESKRRDVLNFVLAIRPGDLLVTDDGGSLLLGRVLDEAVSLVSAAGSTVLTRPVSWSPASETRITDLPTGLRSRLRFKGEDVVNLSELVDQLEVYEIDRTEAPEPADDEVAEGTPAPDSTAVEAGPAPRATLTCDTMTLAKKLYHADDSWLRELLDALDERRQVILEGPPGTGKRTWRRSSWSPAA